MAQGLAVTPDYRNLVRDPANMGLGPGSGKINANFAGLGAYMKAFTGTTNAFKNASRSSLVGSRGYVDVGGLCKDVASGESVARYDYFNSATTGGMLGGMTKDATTMAGAVTAMMGGFGGPAEPECESVALSTIGSDGIERYNAQHVPVSRLCKLDPGVFQDASVRQRICSKSGFTTQMPDDPLAKAYLGGVSILGLYILMALLSERKAS